MTSRHGDTRSVFPFIHAIAPSEGGRDSYHVTQRARVAARGNTLSGTSGWMLIGCSPILECGGGGACHVYARGVTSRTGPAGVIQLRGGGRRGGVRKGGVSNCPFVDLQRDNCNARGFSLYFACVGSGTPTLQFSLLLCE